MECSGARTGSNTVRSGFDTGLIGVGFGDRGGSVGRDQDWVRSFGRGGKADDVTGFQAAI